MPRSWMLLGLLGLLFAAAVVACSDNDSPYTHEELTVDWPSFDPNRYHWDGLTNPYGELWNWRLYVPELDEALTIAMGVSNPGSDDADARGGFVYLSGGDRSQPTIELYSLRDFKAGRQTADIRVGTDRGTETVLRGSVGGDEPVDYDLVFQIDQDWDNTFGLLTNIPELPTNWYVNALSARVSGTLSVNGAEYTLDNVPALQDHVWGTDIPSRSISLFARHFENPTSALAFFGGDLSLGPIELPVIMLAIFHEGVLYEFRSQDLDIGGNISQDETGHWNIKATRGQVRATIEVLNTQSEPDPGIGFTEEGVGFAGSTWNRARVDVTVERYNEGPGWTRLFRMESDQAQLTLGVSDLYQDF